MPKSKNRKEHKKKSAQRTKSLKARQEKVRREWINMIQNAQQESMKRYEEQQNVEETIGDIGDIQNLDDIQEVPITNTDIPNEIGDIGDIGKLEE